jgi:hypothetical protein
MELFRLLKFSFLLMEALIKSHNFMGLDQDFFKTHFFKKRERQAFV